MHIIYIIYRRSYIHLFNLLSKCTCIYLKRAWRKNVRSNYRYSSIIQTLLLKEKKLRWNEWECINFKFCKLMDTSLT